jgi:tetratricopeptide (TPR) repeat protein
MENEFGLPFEDSSQEQAIVKRYEEMLSKRATFFFDVDEFEDLVNYYNEKNDASKAIDVIEYALELHPNSASLLVSKAQIYVSIHKPQEALRYLNMAENFEPFNIDLFYIKGTIFSQLRKSDKAVEQYKKAIEHAELNEKEDIKLQLAFELENTNKYDEAICYLKDILNNNPDNETALYEIGFCFDVSEKVEEGKDFFANFVDINPYSYIGWYNLGITFGKLELYEKAISCYDFAIAIKEDFSSAYFNKAHCFSQKEEYLKALECFNETLALDKEDSLSLYYIGECFEKLNKLEKAISSYKKAIEIDDFIADAWFGIGNCYFEMERFNESLFYIKKALSLDDSNADYYYLLGDTQCDLGFLEEAYIAYKKVYELEPNDETILIDLGNISNEMKESDRAMDYFCEGVKKQPKNGKLLYNFVAFLLKKGDNNNALFYLDAALKEFYKEKEELFEAYEDAKYNDQVIELIEYYKTK